MNFFHLIAPSHVMRSFFPNVRVSAWLPAFWIIPYGSFQVMINRSLCIEDIKGQHRVFKHQKTQLKHLKCCQLFMVMAHNKAKRGFKWPSDVKGWKVSQNFGFSDYTCNESGCNEKEEHRQCKFPGRRRCSLFAEPPPYWRIPCCKNVHLYHDHEPNIYHSHNLQIWQTCP